MFLSSGITKLKLIHSSHNIWVNKSSLLIGSSLPISTHFFYLNLLYSSNLHSLDCKYFALENSNLWSVTKLTNIWGYIPYCKNNSSNATFPSTFPSLTPLCSEVFLNHPEFWEDPRQNWINFSVTHRSARVSSFSITYSVQSIVWKNTNIKQILESETFFPSGE